MSKEKPEDKRKAEESGIRVPADNPIKDIKDDVLNRAKPARSFADQLLLLDISEGAVVGVLGPWGFGKTSFVNLAGERLKELEITILEFNPWMFSGADQLIQAFFNELAAQLKFKKGLNEIGTLIEEYGNSFSNLGWLPFLGPWVERGKIVSEVLSKLLQNKKEGTNTQRDKIKASLRKLDKPIIVILDDIDRLTSPEIRDIFKLVRLTANFPNIIYLLSFDRKRVEQALGEQGIPGRDYLEKIIQIGVDLPAIPETALNTQLFKILDNTLEQIDNPGHFDSEIWVDVFSEVIRPLIKNMRDVRRYVAAVNGTLRDLEGKIALVDVLALEAIRVFLPDVFYELHKSIDGLTSTSDAFGGYRESPHYKMQIDNLIDTSKDNKKVITSLIDRLFPAAQRHIEGGAHYGSEWKKSWLKDRRIAHEDVFKYYFEKIVGEGLQAFTDAEIAWQLMSDEDAFNKYLRAIPIERTEDVISSLEIYEDQYKPEQVVPGIVVLLNILPELPEKPRGLLMPDTTLIVGRVIYRLIRSLKEPDAIEKAVSQILPKVPVLSAKLELVTDIGHQKGAGHKLVPEDIANKFEKEWRDNVRSANIEVLLKDNHLLKVFLITKTESGDDEADLLIPDKPEITLTLIRSAKNEKRSQYDGSRAIRRKVELSWDVLIKLYGTEEVLRQRIHNMAPIITTEDKPLLELCEKYLSGWRPKDHDDD